MRLRALAVGAILGGGVCSQAWAQQQVDLPAVGPERQMNIGVSASVVYDTDFARGSDVLAAARGVEQEETIVTPRLTAAIVQPFGRQVVFLDGSLGYNFHRQNSQLDSRNYNINGGVTGNVSICQPSAFGSYREVQSDLVDLDVGTTRNIGKVTGVGVGGTCGRPVGFGVTTVAHRFNTENTAESAKQSDSTSESLMVGLNYNHPTLGTVSTIFNYTNNEFPNRIIPGRPVGDGFFTQTLGLSLQRKVGSRLVFSGGVGQTRVKREFAPPGERQKFTSTSYNALVEYRLGSRLSFELTGSRAVVPSVRVGKLYDIAQNGAISARYRLGARYELSGGYSIADTKSNADTAAQTAVVTDSRTHVVFTSVAYKPNQRMSLVLDGRYQDRKTNLPDFNYNGFRVGLTAQVNF